MRFQTMYYFILQNQTRRRKIKQKSWADYHSYRISEEPGAYDPEDHRLFFYLRMAVVIIDCFEL